MNRIKSLRISQTPKMSQEKLGNLVGVGRTAVAMWETDKSEPDNATLSKLAEVFHVSVDYLLGRTDQKNMPAPEGERVVRDEEIRAAFFGGADDDLTEEEMDAMWHDAKDYIQYKLEQRRRLKHG